MLRIKLKLKKLGLPDQWFYVNPHDTGLSRQLMRNGLREPINSSYIVATLWGLEGFDVLDIGGNIGYFPLIEALASSGKVRVYEPVFENFRLLEKNLESWENIDLQPFAVGQFAGTQTIRLTDRMNNCSLKPNYEYNLKHGIKETGSRLVHVKSLEEACTGLDKTFLRCDIEGYEKELFTTIPQNVKALSFELHTEILGTEASLHIIDNLERQGFSTLLMTRELDGLAKWFARIGYWSVRLYQLVFSRRVYTEPTQKQIEAIIELQRENPHFTMIRG